MPHGQWKEELSFEQDEAQCTMAAKYQAIASLTLGIVPSVMNHAAVHLGLHGYQLLSTQVALFNAYQSYCQAEVAAVNPRHF